MNRFAPRHGFVLAGLLLVSLAAWSDRHLIPFVAAALQRGGDELNPLWLGYQQVDEEALDHVELPPEVAATQRLRSALEVLLEAQEALRSSLQQTVSSLDHELLSDELDWWTDPELFTDPGVWRAYEEARAAAWPTYRDAVETFLAEARDAGAEAPDNGAFQVMAALAELDLCYRPCPADLIFDWDENRDVGAARITVVDPARLERTLAALEQGLAAATFSFNTHALQAARAEAVDSPGPLGQTERLGAVATILMPELMFTKARAANGLTHLARMARLQGQPGERYLRLARRLALRQGADGESVIAVLVAQANAGLVHEGWLLDAVARGDTTRALAIQREGQKLVRARTRSLRNQAPKERLGTMDWFLLGAGGWERGWNPELGLAVDYAFAETATLWTLIALCLAGLALYTRRAWRSSDQPLSAAPWSLGDLLAVVLPSVGAASVLTLCFFRLHPSTQLGMIVDGGEALLTHVGALALGGATVFAWLLRRATLAKHGLAFARPRLAKGSLVLALSAVLLALFWVGPWSQALLPLTGALALASLVLAELGGAGSLRRVPPALRASVSRYEGRVGLACLGASLALLATVQFAAVSWRRERLTRQVTDQHVGLWLQETRSWGDGKLQDAFRDLLRDAPQRPLTNLERNR